MEPETLSSEPTSPLTLSPQPLWLIPLLILISVFVAAAVIGTAVVIITLTQTFPVTVIADGVTRQIDTHPGDVAGLLQAASVAVSEGDRISPSPDTVLASGMVVVIDRARSIFVTVDGQTTPLWTALTSPADILASARVNVAPADRIQIDGTDATLDQLAHWLVPVSAIVVRHALTVRVHDETGVRTLTTTASTVGEALFNAGITLYLTDATTPDSNTPLTSSLDVTITRASPVEIIADGAIIRTRSPGTTVADALADAGVALVGMDYAIPAESTPLQPGMSIRIIRVRESVDAQQQPLAFETVYQPDSSLELDTQQVAQAGQAGIQETRVRVRYENGSAVERGQPETVVVQAPVNRVIHYGTNVVIRTLDTPTGTVSYWRKLRMYVTSYHPVNGDSTTATGRTLQQGIVGSDPHILPYGTQIYVDGYGVGEVQDTGPRRTIPLWVDLGYGVEDYRGWYGYHDVYILTPVPTNIDYRLTG